jgi:SAM-dependent methyltransferase
VFPLVERGCEVAGVDLSEGMLTRARAKAAALPPANRPTFQLGDVRTAEMGRTFDSCIMMFAVLGYQLDNADVVAALRTARKHLKPGGIFVFDVWYGPAVLAMRPTPKFRIIPMPTGRMLRYSLAELDAARHRSSVYFHLWQLEGDKVISETEETHAMRFFFPLELAYFCETAGLSLLRLGAFPDFEKDPSEQTWNITGVARAV